MHYVIGDVHGCYEELMALMTKIEKKDRQARFILIGDLVDRGPKVWEVLYWAMKHISKDGKYQCVRGNHEQMVIEWYFHDYSIWYYNQDYYTPKEELPKTYYDFSEVMEKKGYKEPEKLETIIEMFQNMPLNKKIKIKTRWGKEVTYRIVHSWYEYGNISESQQFITNLEKRCNYMNDNEDEIIIHGHTCTIDPTYIQQDTKPDRPGMIAYRKNSVNLDGGCCFAKRMPYPCMLCALCLETFEEIYPYTLENRFFRNSGKSITDEEAELYADVYQNEYMMEENPYRLEMLKKLGWNGEEDIPLDFEPVVDKNKFLKKAEEVLVSEVETSAGTEKTIEVETVVETEKTTEEAVTEIETVKQDDVEASVEKKATKAKKTSTKKETTEKKEKTKKTSAKKETAEKKETVKKTSTKKETAEKKDTTKKTSAKKETTKKEAIKEKTTKKVAEKKNSENSNIKE